MKKVVFGIILLLTGSLLLAFNLEILPIEYKRIVFSWPMILVAIGLMNLFNKESSISGVILLIVGSYFMIPRVFPDQIEVAKLYWPVILIVIGAVILFKKNIFNFKKRFKATTTESGFIEEVNIFGGNKQKINAPFFKGGKIINVFGGSSIDLTHTQLEEGKNILELVCVFGGVELIVPSDWIVHIEASSVLGGFSDKRAHPTTQVQTDKELIIKGVVVFGGGEIKNFSNNSF